MVRLINAILAVTLLVGCTRDQDRYEALAITDFFFNKVGESREFIVTPKRLSVTEVVIYSEKDSLKEEMLEKNPLQWKVTAQAFRDGELLDEILLKASAAKPAGPKLQFYSDMSLGSFSKFKWEIFPSPVLIRLTVEEPDPRFNQADETLKIGVRASPIP